MNSINELYKYYIREKNSQPECGVEKMRFFESKYAYPLKHFRDRGHNARAAYIFHGFDLTEKSFEYNAPTKQ